jgi:hypothetical protein
MRVISILILLLSSAAIGAASTISGVVRNQSRGEPAVGDEVILIRLDQGMLNQEVNVEAQTRTTAQGAFLLNVQHPDQAYLVRIIHQNVNYDQAVSVGNEITITVFDALPHVPELSGTIEILRAGVKGHSLHVSDMYEIRNASKPPTTQAGERTFEVYLPASAKVDSVLAAGPGRIGVMITAIPVPGEPGHYSVNFPLRPGATKFAFNYDLPYDGHAAFQTRHIYPLQQFAVMIPPTMKFSSHSPDFQTLETGGNDYQVHAVSPLIAGEGPGFSISGTGNIPPLRYQSKIQSPAQFFFLPNSTVSAPDHVIPPVSGHPGSRNRTLSRVSALFWIGLGYLFLSACIFIVWRKRKVRADASRGRGPDLPLRDNSRKLCSRP